MGKPRWARLRSAAAGKLRLGAWYPVESVTATEVRVQVHGRLERVARALVELREEPPQEWTVVRGPFNAVRVPVSAREGYVVCPNCRQREPIPESRQATKRCSRCNGAFAIAWDRVPVVPTGAAMPSGPDTLRGDRRLSRRRAGKDRRSGPRGERDRRSARDRRNRPTKW